MELVEIQNTIRASIIEIITEDMEMETDEIDVKDDDSLIDGGLIDSMSILQLIEACQMEFDISIDPAELSIEHWDSINKICRFVQLKLNDEDK